MLFLYLYKKYRPCPSEFTTIQALQMLALNSGRLQIRLNNIYRVPVSFGICTPEGLNIRICNPHSPTPKTSLKKTQTNLNCVPKIFIILRKIF